MNWILTVFVVLVSCPYLINIVSLQDDEEGPFSWMRKDNFDLIIDRMDAINSENCRSKPLDDLRLPSSSVAQLPLANQLLSTIIYSNRSRLLHIHNMALNRAFFYSYIMQKLNETHQVYLQPTFRYFLYSLEADVAANENYINGSGLFYDTNCSYPNWYTTVPVNRTIRLFGPRSFRAEDFNEPSNWLREPTNLTMDITDYGAGFQSDYTDDRFKNGPWYQPDPYEEEEPMRWLPDRKKGEERDEKEQRKFGYNVGMKMSDKTGHFVEQQFLGRQFFGPPAPGMSDQFKNPVYYTVPYFDCGHSNKWIISGVSPVVEHLPRYLDWNHLRSFRFVAVTAIDTDFLQTDINPCPLGRGNPKPNMFAGIARCKPTTMCEPLPGWGFRRGGYQCACKPGHRYPPFSL